MAAERKRFLVLLGPPGAGKGTQAVKIASEYGIPHISTGDIFRANIKEGTDLGRKAKKYLDSGELVPDSVVTEIVADRVKKDDCKHGFLLDGFPRTLPQAEALDKMLNVEGCPLTAVVNVDVDREALIHRLTARRTCSQCGENYNLISKPPKEEGICNKCGGKLYQREDDKRETIENRLAVYEKQTAPLIDHYQRSNRLVTISGEGAIDEVFSRIRSALN
ncbi:MAG: adenylate kinase [Candidatus Abyssobacteria bacterium SURF_5]|uniref:Adenylate kinase n=1 Tax=Abyssobacteria bacterium (strain SURF_5) TaxID=2093360 RepID=A0A3A4NSP5_ABYX5|nr:MAG: adenylate kinase [Candidatus Abyssubacteria bacterium SURF_5]